jgi:hypothetical protein
LRHGHIDVALAMTRLGRIHQKRSQQQRHMAQPGLARYALRHQHTPYR